MPCTSPVQGFFDGPNGQFRYCPKAQEAFKEGKPLGGQSAVPCGNCISCRMKRSREWAIRCTHEAQEYESNSFLTFTFSNEAMEKMCPKAVWESPFSYFSPEEKPEVFEGYSISKSHMQKFNKDLRDRLGEHRIRYMYCGEYGGKTQRPHYHSILFNYDFPDRELYKVDNGFKYYNSEFLNSLWPHGHAVIAAFNFNTAAYVARYVLKKVNGRGKNLHYKGRVPEFSGYSRMPGLGAFWFDKYWKDLYPRDECVVDVDGDKLVFQPPRFYDKCLSEKDPEMLEYVKAKRREKQNSTESDNTFERLVAKEKCTEARLKTLVRKLEESNE